VETVWQFLKKLTTELPYDPVILFLGIYPKVMKADMQVGICIPMFIVALLTMAKGWKAPSSSVHELLNG
jgi:hypothetical protein